MTEQVERTRVARRLAWPAGEWPWAVLAVSAIVAQQLAIRHLAKDGFELSLRRVIFLGTTGALVLLVWPFRRYVGAWLIALGIVLNFLPMAAHGGFMPISYEVAAESGLFPSLNEGDIGQHLDNSKDIIEREGDIRFAPLADRYIVDLPGYGTNVYSLGDFVLFAGVAAAALQALIAPFLAPLVARRSRPARAPLAEG